MSDVLKRIVATPGLPQLEIASAAFAFTEHSTWLALMIYAFMRGGAPEAGLVGFVLLIPAMITAPIGATVGQRRRPRGSLAIAAVLLSLANLATAAAIWSGSGLLAYVAGGLGASLITLPRPIASSLLPSLARTPQDLVAANVVTSIIEQTGKCAGPVGAGAIIALSSPALVFAIAAGATLISAAAALRLPEIDALAPGEQEPIMKELLGGFDVIRRDVKLRWLVAMLATGSMCNGVVDVLSVTFAETRLGLGEAAAGWLMAAFGGGAILGGAAASGLVAGRKMSGYFAAAGALIAVTFASLGGATFMLLGLGVFAVNGAGQALVGVICNIAMQRHAPPHALHRVFGVVESMHMLGLAIGSLAFARLTAAVSLSMTLLTIAIAVAAIALVALARLVSLRVLDAPPPADIFARIAADPLFAPLGLPRLERLATVAEYIDVPAGTTIIREGEPGHHYFLIRRGTVSVGVDGQAVRDMGSGESFGEIALVMDSPRTATVTAVSDAQLLRVSRDEFLEALSLDARSRRHAGATAQRYLAEDDARRSAS